jgi:glycine cleavage system aminomethyltransferase T
MGKGFGLAWVPVELAQDGAEIHIIIDGRPMLASVTMQPFYDPDGARLRQ